MTVKSWFLLGVGLAVGVVVCALGHDARAQTRTEGEQLRANFEQFDRQLDDAATKLGAPATFSTSIAEASFAGPWWPFGLVLMPTMPAPPIGSLIAPQYRVKVSVELLRSAGGNYRWFAAAHQVCHVTLGHPVTKRDSSPEEEVAATTCACELLGRTHCVDAFDEMLRYHNLTDLVAKNRAELEEIVMRLYGGKLAAK